MEVIPYKISLSDFINYVQSPNTYSFNNEVILVEIAPREEEEINLKFMPACVDGFSVFFVLEGESAITIDFISYHLKKNMFYILTSQHVITRISFSKDFKGYYVLANRDFMLSSIDKVTPITGILNPRLNPVLELKEENFNLLIDSIKYLQKNISRTEHFYLQAMVKNAFANLILDLWFLTASDSEENETPEFTNHEELVKKFLLALFENIKVEREVAFYATKLCVSPVYLSRITKEITGKTAIKVIGEVLLVEIKVLLRQPNMFIQEIATIFNFSDQASLSKFFKKQTGLSPLEYRKSINYNQ